MTVAEKCSNPPEESCSDAGCPVHGWDGENFPMIPQGQIDAEVAADVRRLKDAVIADPPEAAR